MKLDVARRDLRALRDVVWSGSVGMNPETVAIADKAIRRLNRLLTEVHGHDFDGKIYLE